MDIVKSNPKPDPNITENIYLYYIDNYVEHLYIF
jgi:hypothetical protein